MSDETATEPATPTRPLWRRLLWPDWPARKRILRVEAWVAVIASYALLALGYLWPQGYRNESPAYVLVAWAAFLSRVLQFHVGLLLLAIALVAAFGRGRRLFLAAVPPVLFTLAPAWWAYLPRTPPANTPSPALRVMTCNLLMVNRDTGPIIAEVLAARPDVLLLQEYTAEWHEAMTAAGVGRQLPYSSFVTRDDSFGVAVYSRFPLVGEVDNRFPLGRAGVEQTRAVVRVGGRDVAVYNVHLLPPRRLDYVIDGRLQFASLLDALAAEKLPYVLAGDLNLTGDTPQHYDLLRLGARDAHDAAGRGRGATWPVNSFLRYVPGLRMDHVYTGNGLAAVACETGEGRGSDHRPVIAAVAWDGSAPAAAAGPAPTSAEAPAPATAPSAPAPGAAPPGPGPTGSR
jgi:endonuclease/exonuclease/phosphatase (EEP) superfamily protein YafD